MNKTEAAAFLEIAPRSLERYTAQGRIDCVYVRGKTRPTAEYSTAALKRFKKALQTPTARPITAIAPMPPNPDNKALARIGGIAKQRGSGELALLSELLKEYSGAPRPAKPDARQAAVKILLTLPEAQSLTGLSRSTLRAAIDDGALKARLIGRAFRIKRGDLDSYIEKL